LLFNLRRFAIFISLVVYACAAFGVIDTQWFGYRLLPGVLFIFLLGSLLYDLQNRAAAQSRGSAILAGITVSAVGAFAALLHYFDKLALPFNRETLLGLAIGVVLLHLLARRERRPWDEALGALSYGVFLNHFLVKWALFDEAVGHNAASVSAFLGVSILLAAVMYRAVEKPALAMRRKLRAAPAGGVPAASLTAGRGEG
jgi:peptidoglycan/LPS O-acetylase OafA/YrhL